VFTVTLILTAVLVVIVAACLSADFRARKNSAGSPPPKGR
jgi:hypothetical protein